MHTKKAMKAECNWDIKNFTYCQMHLLPKTVFCFHTFYSFQSILQNHSKISDTNSVNLETNL